MPFTLEEKVKELDRELTQRHRVYRWMVSKGKLKEDEAQRRIKIMTEIATDYRNKLKEGPLFSGMGMQP